MKNLLEPTRIAWRFNEKLISKVLKVLRQNFNLADFYFFKIDACGNYFLFRSENPEVIEAFERGLFMAHFPMHCDVRHLQDLLAITFYRDDPLLNDLPETRERFLSLGLRSRLRFGSRTQDAYQEFGFNSSSDSAIQCRSLVNNLPELRLFSRWFLEQNKGTLQFLQENSIQLPTIVGKEFYQNRLRESDPMVRQRRKFLIELGIEPNVEFSEPEKETVRLVVKGHSASQIGTILNCSKRTIEHRMERIKSRWNCSSKSELVQKAQEILF